MKNVTRREDSEPDWVQDIQHARNVGDLAKIPIPSHAPRKSDAQTLRVLARVLGGTDQIRNAAVLSYIRSRNPAFFQELSKMLLRKDPSQGAAVSLALLNDVRLKSGSNSLAEIPSPLKLSAFLFSLNDWGSITDMMGARGIYWFGGEAHAVRVGGSFLVAASEDMLFYGGSLLLDDVPAQAGVAMPPEPQVPRVSRIREVRQKLDEIFSEFVPFFRSQGALSKEQWLDIYQHLGFQLQSNDRGLYILKDAEGAEFRTTFPEEEMTAPMTGFYQAFKMNIDGMGEVQFEITVRYPQGVVIEIAPNEDSPFSESQDFRSPEDAVSYFESLGISP